MPTPTRPQRSGPAASGRFTRTTAAPPRMTTRRRSPGPRRGTAPGRRGVAGGWLQRGRPQKQSGVKKALGAVTGALPGIARSSSKSRRGGKGGRAGKAGGFALLTAAAGLAFKNRDKVTSKIRRDQPSDGGHGETVPVTPSPTLDTAPEGVASTTTGMPAGDGAATAEDDAPKR